MSGTFPTLTGPSQISIESEAPTLVSTAQSGRRFTREMGAQRWRIKASYDLLTNDEARSLMGFVAAQRGQYDSFQYKPPHLAARGADWMNWSEVNLPPSAPRWWDLTYDANNAKFCAIAYESNVAAISTDGGITWQQTTLPLNTRWIAVAWNGSQFCAIANNTNIAATSPDGITWTQRALPTTAAWFDIVWNGTAGVFCAIAYGSTIAATSSDGITWTQRTLPVNTNWQAITELNGLFCAVAANTSIAATSSDGITWTQRALPVSANWYDVWRSGSVFCAIATGSNIAATSSDGITWTQRTLPTTASWVKIHWSGTRFFAVAHDSDVLGTSSDGITWSLRKMPASRKWRSIRFGGTQVIAIAEYSTLGARSTNINVSAPMVNGASQTGRTLATWNWNNSTTVLKAGDFFRVAGHNKVYMLTADATTNGSGQVTLNFEPALLVSPSNNEAVLVDEVIFTVAFAKDAQVFPTQPPLWYSFEADLIEVY